ncbi:MAG TPA: hypothetical protein VFI11_07960 [Anaerolineales bacterium]|nr:hypothetical protein [Anaerolineales bacterium]
MKPTSIAAVNRLPDGQKREIYLRIVPRVLVERFHLPPDFVDSQGRDLADLRCASGSTDVVLALRHQAEAPDPLLYAHVTDTMNGQMHVLLYIVNDPESPRFDVDRMPDGRPTEFGVFRRNLPAEQAALRAGLAPGQVRHGLRALRDSIEAFENLVASLGHDVFFVDPLFYHNAVVFESYGFGYQQGRRLMEGIHSGFLSGGALLAGLDSSSVFRQPGMAHSIRGRSWAIHDGLLGYPFTNVTMFKHVGRNAGVSTFPNGAW